MGSRLTDEEIKLNTPARFVRFIKDHSIGDLWSLAGKINWTKEGARRLV